MAKRKKKSHHHKARRGHKMGALGGETMQTIVGVALGAIGGRYLSSSSLVPSSITPTIKNLALLGFGSLIVVKSKKPMLKGIGAGLVAGGAIGEGLAFGFLSGVDDTIASYSPTRNLADAAKVQMVGAASNRFPQPGVVGFPDIHVVGGML